MTGTGTAMRTPNTVNVQISVHTVATNAQSALSANNEKMSALVAALRSHGVGRSQTQTSGVDIYQNTNANGVVVGFTVDDDLNVTINNLSSAGRTIDAAIRAVGKDGTLNAVTLSISNEGSLLAKARDRAIAQARLTAGQLAQATHVHITGVVRISNSGPMARREERRSLACGLRRLTTTGP